MQLAIALDRAVTHKDVIEHPVLADLAGLIDGRSGVSRDQRPIRDSD